MGANNMPGAEVDIDERLVATLLQEQHPDLAALEIEPLANGWDNALFRLGDELTIRLPRRQQGAELVGHEAEWLPLLAPHLPLPVPAPVRVGRAQDAYPWDWTIVPYFQGQPVGKTPFSDPAGAAIALGDFLAALHRPAPEDAPHNPFRGGPLAERNRTARDRLEAVAGQIDRRAVERHWRAASGVPAWEGPPMWLHGDLHPLNLIQRNGELVAVIDFGDITSGDPATDFLAAWSLFDEEHRSLFRTAADSPGRPIDDDLWERGRAWAIAHSLAILANAADAPALSEMAHRTLAAATT